MPGPSTASGATGPARRLIDQRGDPWVFTGREGVFNDSTGKYHTVETDLGEHHAIYDFAGYSESSGFSGAQDESETMLWVLPESAGGPSVDSGGDNSNQNPADEFADPRSGDVYRIQRAVTEASGITRILGKLL